jgi:hypothetical protein
MTWIKKLNMARVCRALVVALQVNNFLTPNQNLIIKQQQASLSSTILPLHASFKANSIND